MESRISKFDDISMRMYEKGISDRELEETIGVDVDLATDNEDKTNIVMKWIKGLNNELKKGKGACDPIGGSEVMESGETQESIPLKDMIGGAELMEFGGSI
ncbi:hypothetical protein IFM89_009184 [Coptis chinensis]|uniref:Uncharacterized protein n=1 Tax=Coptis chinensis TaxID=261450 RepID=A0A835IVE8_9MAGN|nr:hypothetical protein IFM89_009184 [Coptis chinensis]